jgi:hypothetical protein
MLNNIGIRKIRQELLAMLARFFDDIVRHGYLRN